MVTEWLLLAVAVALVAANALFVAAEFSLVTVDRASVTRAAEAGDSPAAGVARALRSLSTQLSGAQLGITVTSLAVGFIAEPSIARLLDGPLRRLGLGDAPATATSIALALALATVFQMVLGELVPKNLAIARPLPVARRVAGAQRGFTTATKPLIAFLNGSANRLLRLFGIEPQEELRSARSPQELSSLVQRSAAQGTLAGPTAETLSRSLEFGELTAADVMTPRVRMDSVPETASLAEVVARARETGHSRFPVTGASVDDVTGLVHVKHVLSVPRDRWQATRVSDVMSEPVLVPESLDLDDLLHQLRARGLQMAVVVDEYGGTHGVATLEDVVEEIVGSITDEHDESAQDIERPDDRRWLVPGLLRPDELQHATGIALGDDPRWDTLAGLVLEHTGALPDVGTSVTVESPSGPVQLTVERMDGHRIDRLIVEGPSDESSDAHE